MTWPTVDTQYMDVIIVSYYLIKPTERVFLKNPNAHMLILCPTWLADSIHLSIHKSQEIYGLFPNGFPKVCWVSWQRDSNSGWSRYREQSWANSHIPCTKHSPTGPYLQRLCVPASRAWLTRRLHRLLWTWGYLWRNQAWFWPSSCSRFLSDSIRAGERHVM